MTYVIKITVSCTDRIDKVAFSVNGIDQHVNWKRSLGFTRYFIEELSVNDNPMSFGLSVKSFKNTKYTYVIENKDNDSWKVVDKDTHSIVAHGGVHAFEKTIVLLPVQPGGGSSSSPV